MASRHPLRRPRAESPGTQTSATELQSLIDFRALQQSIDEELRERIRNHRASISRLRLLPRSRRPLNLLATGDSWFDYPLTKVGPVNVPIPSDILVQLKSLLQPAPTILSLAHFGLMTTDLLGVQRYNSLVAQLSHPQNGKWDGILFSGGGNDLVGDKFRLWLNDIGSVGGDPTKALDDTALNDIVGVAMTAYDDLLAARDTFAPGTPIFVHAYDFPLPTGIPVCGVGPWVYPSLKSRGWMKTTSPADLVTGAEIVKAVLERFDTELTKLENAGKNVIYVKTQGTLPQGPQSWANELHPTPRGFKSIARKFAVALTGLSTAKGPKARLSRRRKA